MTHVRSILLPCRGINHRKFSLMSTEFIDDNLPAEEHWFHQGKYQHQIDNFKHLVSRFFLPVFAYLAMFVGTGFLSGAIVHSGDVSEIPRNLLIGLVGLVVFMVGSAFFEIAVLKHALTWNAVPRFLFFSMLLSISIGMISGGVQHFTDFPNFAPKIIPLGLVLAVAAFGFKHRVDLHAKWGLLVAAITLVLGGGVYLLTSTLAAPYLANPPANHHGPAPIISPTPTDESNKPKTPEATMAPVPNEADPHGH